MTLLATLIIPVALFATIPVQNITDHCFCDLSGHVPHCRIKEQHPMSVQFAIMADGSENDNCVFDSDPVVVGGNGSTDFVSCEHRDAIIEWKEVSSDDAYYISDDKDVPPAKLDIIAVQTVNQKNERMLMPLTLNADLVVDKANSCHLLLPSSDIKALLLLSR